MGSGGEKMICLYMIGISIIIYGIGFILIDLYFEYKTYRFNKEFEKDMVECVDCGSRMHSRIEAKESRCIACLLDVALENLKGTKQKKCT